MASYSSALNLLATKVVQIVERKLKSKKKYKVHCVDIVGSYVRIFITKIDVPSGPLSQHKDVRFIEITQAKHDQDKWQVGYGNDLGSNEPLGKMVGFFYPKTEVGMVSIANNGSRFLNTGETPPLPAPKGAPAIFTDGTTSFVTV